MGNEKIGSRKIGNEKIGNEKIDNEKIDNEKIDPRFDNFDELEFPFQKISPLASLDCTAK